MVRIIGYGTVQPEETLRHIHFFDKVEYPSSFIGCCNSINVQEQAPTNTALLPPLHIPLIDLDVGDHSFALSTLHIKGVCVFQWQSLK